MVTGERSPLMTRSPDAAMPAWALRAIRQPSATAATAMSLSLKLTPVPPTRGVYPILFCEVHGLTPWRPASVVASSAIREWACLRGGPEYHEAGAAGGGCLRAFIAVKEDS